MYTYSFPRLLSIAVVSAGLLLSAAQAGAASQCKGKTENLCADDASCSWVAGYTRKDGRAVSSHCRLKRGAKTDTATGTNSIKLSQKR